MEGRTKGGHTNDCELMQEGKLNAWNHKKENDENDENEREVLDDALIDLLTGEERVERGLISSMEARRSRVRTSFGESWLTAADGERPPLGSNIPFEQFYENAVQQQNVSKPPTNSQTHSNHPVHHRSSPPAPRLATVTHKVAPILRPPRITSRSATTGGHVSYSVNKGDKVSEANQVRTRFQNAVMKIHRMNSLTKTENPNQISDQGPTVIDQRQHRRSASRAQVFLDSIQGSECDIFDAARPNSEAIRIDVPSFVEQGNGNRRNDDSKSRNRHRRNSSVVFTEEEELLVKSLGGIEQKETCRVGNEATYEQNQTSAPTGNNTVARKSTEESDDSIFHFLPQTTTSESLTDLELGDEKLPLLQKPSGKPDNCNGVFEYNSTNVSGFRDGFHGRKPSEITASAVSFHRKKLQQKNNRYYQMKEFLVQILNPLVVLNIFYQTFQESYFLLASIPLCSSALILFYVLGNPRLYFLPGDATLAWWLHFIGRQCITLELSRFIQWFLIDYIVLRTRLAVQYVGPFVTLLCIQSKGWPFLAMCWSILDLFLLHGNNKFQLHWLYFTNISFCNEANSGSYVLVSNLYLRVLLSVLLIGFTSSVKRSMMAVAFGRRTFSMFKPRLENILKDIILLSEVADLADEVECLSRSQEGFFPKSIPAKVNILGSDYNWARDRLQSRDGPLTPDRTDDDFNDDLTETSDVACEDETSNAGSQNGDLPHCNSNKSAGVKDLVDRWEEPVNKLDKSISASVRDILKFRRALTFIDDDNPFGTSFGPATTRDQVLQSAESVYSRLLQMCPNSTILSYEALEILVSEEDGDTVNEIKKKALKKMFRPNADNEVSLLVFLQSCDALYKKLRFFRASVGNASVIDKALEGMINAIFYFVLVLSILSLLNINPWPLLVSVSTLLVSVSFAVGSSASKYIEGILLIAVRRPYDLGDRIYMMDPSRVDGGFIGSSWFIEDINLSFTTVRYASSNEVATLSNGSIASLRIVNGNRSPNAVIQLDVPFHIAMAFEKKNKLDVLRSLVEKYVRDYPNHWKCLMYCRISELNVELEKATVAVAIQHQSSWQDLGRIMTAKADLVCYLYEISKSLDVTYVNLPKQKLLYYAGLLKDGKPSEYQKGLTSIDNIKSYADNEEKLESEDTFLKNLQKQWTA